MGDIIHVETSVSTSDDILLSSIVGALSAHILPRHRGSYYLWSVDDYTDAESVIKRIAKMTVDFLREIHIRDEHYAEQVDTEHTPVTQTPAMVDPHSMATGPSLFKDLEPSQDYSSQPTQKSIPVWYTPDYVPCTISLIVTEPVTGAVERHGIIGDEQHGLHDRSVRPPQHYTPGSDALPYRARRRC